MTATLEQLENVRPGKHLLFEGVSWDEYTRVLHEIEDAGLHYQVTFDHGRMEIMTTGARHEGIKKTVGRLVEVYSLELDIPITGLGGVTLRRKDLQQGLEADECYYVQTPAPPMPPGSEELDLTMYPPPDLAIEVDISRGSISTHSIYAALGVPEVWQFNGQIVTPFVRQPDGQYRRSERSVSFPDLPIEDLNRFVAMAVAGMSQHEVVKAFVAWLRSKAG